MSFEDAVNMPMASLQAYLERLPARLAEVKMMLVEPLAVPHLKKNDQSRMMNGWMKDATISTPAKKPVPAMLNMMGIGVRFEKAVNSDQSAVNSDQSAVNSDQSAVNSDQLAISD
jgi:hypothetical protein